MRARRRFVAVVRSSLCWRFHPGAAVCPGRRRFCFLSFCFVFLGGREKGAGRGRRGALAPIVLRGTGSRARPSFGRLSSPDARLAPRRPEALGEDPVRLDPARAAAQGAGSRLGGCLARIGRSSDAGPASQAVCAALSLSFPPPPLLALPILRPDAGQGKYGVDRRILNVGGILRRALGVEPKSAFFPPPPHTHTHTHVGPRPWKITVRFPRSAQSQNAEGEPNCRRAP